MAISKFSGKAKWAKVREGQQDEKYENWSIDLYMDDPNLALYARSGAQLQVRDGEEGKYVSFKRKTHEFNYKTEADQTNEPPTIYLKDSETNEYNLWPEGFVGNGSDVTVSVDIFTTRNGKGSRLMRVFVDNLVEYNPDLNAKPDTAELPF